MIRQFNKLIFKNENINKIIGNKLNYFGDLNYVQNYAIKGYTGELGLLKELDGIMTEKEIEQELEDNPDMEGYFDMLTDIQNQHNEIEDSIREMITMEPFQNFLQERGDLVKGLEERFMDSEEPVTPEEENKLWRDRQTIRKLVRSKHLDNFSEYYAHNKDNINPDLLKTNDLEAAYDDPQDDQFYSFYQDDEEEQQ